MVGPDTAAAAVAPWDERGAAYARLEDEAAAVTALLERFGSLLTVALDAAGSGDDTSLDAAVAERAWVLAELEPLLASLAAARDARGPRAGSLDPATVQRILAPVHDALGHARLLHERLSDDAREPRLRLVP